MLQRRTIGEVFKFMSVGALNTAIDLGVLNVLIAIWGVHADSYFFLKAIAFIAAVVNSYLWNKYWVFRNSRQSTARESSLFLAASLAGLLANSAASSVALAILQAAIPNLSVVIAANLSAIVGTLVVFSLNFLSYKFVVFRHKPSPSQVTQVNQAYV